MEVKLAMNKKQATARVCRVLFVILYVGGFVFMFRNMMTNGGTFSKGGQAVAIILSCAMMILLLILGKNIKEGVRAKAYRFMGRLGIVASTVGMVILLFTK